MAGQRVMDYGNMKMMKPNNVNEYIAAFPAATQKLLEQVRATIKKTAPDAEEVISYAMPGYRWKGMLVWFAGYEHHIGFYPGSSGIAAFQREIAQYKNAKGSVQFPINQPMPLDLIVKMVQFRLQENETKALMKKTKLK